MCRMSLATYHGLRVICHMSHVICKKKSNNPFFVEKVVKLVGGGSVINGATPSSFRLLQLWGEVLTYLRQKTEFVSSFFFLFYRSSCLQSPSFGTTSTLARCRASLLFCTPCRPHMAGQLVSKMSRPATPQYELAT